MTANLRVTLGSLDLTAAPYLVEWGSDLGAPESVVQVLTTFLQDGEFEISERSGNRTLSLPVLIESDLAAAEAALVIEASKQRNELTIQTHDELPPTVFEVFGNPGSVVLERDDDRERANIRKWNVSLRAAPFGLDKAFTTVQATDGLVTPVTVSIDNGSSATNWSSTSGTVTTSGSAIQLGTGGSAIEAGLLRTGSVSLPTETRIITVDASYEYGTDLPFALSLQATVGGPRVATTLVAAHLQPTGFTRYAFKVPASFPTTAATLFFVWSNISGYGDTAIMRIDQVSRTNTIPGSGTNRQQSRSLMVGGSVRARASLAITAPAGQTLGELTILYTRTATTGLQPPLRPYYVSGGTAFPEANTVSGSYHALSSVATYLIPARRLREALFNLSARLRATTAGTYTLSWGARLVGTTGSQDFDSATITSGSLPVSLASANVWQFTDLGVVQLPTVPVAQDSDKMISLTLQASSGVVQIDEGWLFDLDNGVLSVANTTGLTRFEARTPDLGLPRPSYWGGVASGGVATGLVRADMRLTARGTHVFNPGTVDIFTVTTGTEGSVASATYRRAWHTHAAA